MNSHIIREFPSRIMFLPLFLPNWDAPEASSLLCDMLQQRDEKRHRMVEHLAKKRGIPSDEMWKQLVNGTHKPIDQDEAEDLYREGEE